MSAKKGNTYAKKFKDKASRLAILRKFCRHVSKGSPKESFADGCTYRTIKRIIQEYPDEVPSDELDIAHARGYQVWTDIGMKLATGEMKGSAASYIFNMSNRFKWTHRREVSGEDGEPIAHQHTVKVEHDPRDRLAKKLEEIVGEGTGSLCAEPDSGGGRSSATGVGLHSEGQPVGAGGKLANLDDEGGSRLREDQSRS